MTHSLDNALEILKKKQKCSCKLVKLRCTRNIRKYFFSKRHVESAGPESSWCDQRQRI